MSRSSNCGIFTRIGTLLEFGTANLVSTLDPEIIVIRGGMAGAADLYLETLKESMFSRAQPGAARKVNVAVSRLETWPMFWVAHASSGGSRRRKFPNGIGMVSI